ncbi:hypothetical protein O0880_09975 [Janthinobacterium sp. SUN118]|uniref:hypothetical protein n=1 Tax=Janthinobacterium sp. SUN118 TaxID=3004100 RepID=UPI0025B1ECF8|nr:hypothetical protein [Janthinobacterium sp. SUN118]MDN2709748.1 hypothetical protein [Janthinobacterium sp. SUN118]
MRWQTLGFNKMQRKMQLELSADDDNVAYLIRPGHRGKGVAGGVKKQIRLRSAARKFRENWIPAGANWKNSSFVPFDWNLVEQLRNIPVDYL